MITFIKITISAAIVCITTYVGIEMAYSLKARQEILTDMVTFLRLIENEMVYMSNSLPVAFEISRQKLVSKLKDTIGAIVVDMQKYGIDKIDASIEMNINDMAELSAYDKQIIISTLKNLGRSDIESQTNIIENAIIILDEQIKEAKDTKIKSSKVYKTVGVVSGLLIVIMFI